MPTWNSLYRQYFALDTHSVYTIQPGTNLQCLFKSRYVGCLCAVACHLHFWQNDQDLLHAAVVTWGWNKYGNKSRHKQPNCKHWCTTAFVCAGKWCSECAQEVDPGERKKLLFLPGLEPATFRSWVWCCNYWAVLAPYLSRDRVFHCLLPINTATVEEDSKLKLKSILILRFFCSCFNFF